MSKNELFEAMRYGSQREYGIKDLGRFGLGLKSASLSQCKKVTVASKLNDHISAYKWDLDWIEQSQKWECIELDDNDIKALPNIEQLDLLPMGMLVVWEDFDFAYKKNDGRVMEYLADEMYEAEKHIKLVFHRFLSRNINPVNIYINNDLVLPVDPFLENHKKTDTRTPSEIRINDQIIKIQPFILPHQSDLSDEDLEKVGGLASLRSGQGFYIYRNDRLIIYGTWFRISTMSMSSELLKYGRIKVDIPNTLDDVWEIDIKKQNAWLISQHIVSLIVDQQQDQTHHQRSHQPHELLTGAVGEIEDAGLVEGITGTVNIQPAEKGQQEEHADGDPVHVLPYVTTY